MRVLCSCLHATPSQCGSRLVEKLALETPFNVSPVRSTSRLSPVSFTLEFRDLLSIPTWLETLAQPAQHSKNLPLGSLSWSRVAGWRVVTVSTCIAPRRNRRWIIHGSFARFTEFKHRIVLTRSKRSGNQRYNNTATTAT